VIVCSEWFFEETGWKKIEGRGANPRVFEEVVRSLEVGEREAAIIPEEAEEKSGLAETSGRS
jgi:hypothetical protein